MIFGVPLTAAAFGIAGLAPFLAGAAAMLGLAPEVAAPVLIGYGAAILSFMGGCLWGFASRDLAGPRGGDLALSVAPSLVAAAVAMGWSLARLSDATALALLACGLAALLFADDALARRGLAPAWWMRLRYGLTAVAVPCLLIGAFA